MVKLIDRLARRTPIQHSPVCGPDTDALRVDPQRGAFEHHASLARAVRCMISCMTCDGLASMSTTLFIGPLQAIGKTVSALPRLRRPMAITAQSRTNIFHDKFLHAGMGVRLLYVSSYVCVLAAPVIRRICNATPLHRLPTGAFTGTPTSRSSF